MFAGESLQAIEKWIQCFGKESVLDAVGTISMFIISEENDEISVSYDCGKYVLSQPYKNSFGLAWHSWSYAYKGG